MDRSWGILAAFSLLLAASACGGPDESPTPPPPSSTSKPPPSKPATSSVPPAFTPAASPAKVIAACPFLGAGELAQIIGTSGTVAKEEPHGTTESAPDFTCAYITGDQRLETAPRLYFFGFIKANPNTPISTTAEDCPGPSTPLPGVGDAAMYCDLDDYWTTLAVAKRVHGETRMLNLHLPQLRQKDGYIQVAKLLGERL